jgi:Ni,Fe-hydrogenase III small subunit
MGLGITWYDALGVLPDAAVETIHRTYDAVPDIRGLFYSAGQAIAGKQDLRVTVIRPTEHPMPVDGLVVGQSPRPAAKPRRASELTLQV